MEEITKDKDSMDALQSLLQIRSRGRSESSPSLSRQGAYSASEKLQEIKAEDGSEQQAMQKVEPGHNSGSSSKNKNKRIRVDQHGSLSNSNRSLKNHRTHEPIQPQAQLQPRQEPTLPQSSSASNLLQSPHHHRGLFFPSQSISSMATLGSPLATSTSTAALQSLNTTAASTTMAHIQLVAAQAAMAAAASAVASVSNGHQRLDSHRLLSPQQHQQPITPPSTGPSLLSLDGTTVGTNNTTTRTVNAAGMEEASSSQTTTSTGTTSSSSSIRREKVEAALRSKPQRGKKRDDLSAKERLELTRTRNREHAKTTRIRKKARYQELLECESKLQVLLQQQETEELQRKAVETFVSLRQNMIRCCFNQEGMSGAPGLDYMNDSHSSSSSSSRPSLVVGKENDPSSSSLSSSSSPVPPDQQDKASLITTTTTTKPVDHASILAKLVEDVNQFDLQVSPKVPSTKVHSAEGQPSSHPLTSTMNSLMAMDRQLVDRAVERYGEGAQQYFVCQVSKAGIALTSNTTAATTSSTTAMAEIELHMELTPCNRTHLQTCLLQVRFATNQPVLLQSVSWTVLKDSLKATTMEDLAPKNKAVVVFASTANTKQMSRTVSSSMKEGTDHDHEEDDTASTNESPLQSQSVFPSIVSLEQSKAAGSGGGGGQGGGGGASSNNDATSLGMPL